MSPLGAGVGRSGGERKRTGAAGIGPREAKPNVIRLLPALNITKTEADIFLQAIKTELNP